MSEPQSILFLETRHHLIAGLLVCVCVCVWLSFSLTETYLTFVLSLNQFESMQPELETCSIQNLLLWEQMVADER